MNYLSRFFGYKKKELEDHTIPELRAMAKNIANVYINDSNARKLKKSGIINLLAKNKRYQKSNHARSTKRKFDVGVVPEDIRVKDYRKTDEFELDLDLETIGERIKSEASRSTNTDNDWYANELYSELVERGKEGFPSLGEMCFFSYDAAYPEDYPYYDTRPLVYVMSFEDDKMFGANLHYLNPAIRGAVAGSLASKVGVNFRALQKCIHSYFYSNIDGMYTLPLDPREYADIAELVTENFVDKYGQKVELQSVWDSV